MSLASGGCRLFTTRYISLEQCLALLSQYGADTTSYSPSRQECNVRDCISRSGAYESLKAYRYGAIFDVYYCGEFPTCVYSTLKKCHFVPNRYLFYTCHIVQSVGNYLEEQKSLFAPTISFRDK